MVEHYTDTVGVDSSNLSPRTTTLSYLNWNWNKVEHCTVRVKVSGNSEKAEVLFNDQSQGKKKISQGGVGFSPFLFSPESLIIKTYQGATIVAAKTIPITESVSLTTALDPVTAPTVATPSAPQYDPTWAYSGNYLDNR